MTSFDILEKNFGKFSITGAAEELFEKGEETHNK